MSKPVVLVAGLGRCGTSLMMQMLDAAGLPTVGRYPAFERRWGFAKRGQAVKWIDPHRLPRPCSPTAPTLAIWLDRDPDQQAASQVKMARLLGVPVVPDALADGRYAASLRSDREKSLHVLPLPRLMTTFEALIERPRGVASMVADFLRPHFGPLDASAMAARVLPRTSECQPALDIEMRLCDPYGLAR